jgi:hypothetical protein
VPNDKVGLEVMVEGVVEAWVKARVEIEVKIGLVFAVDEVALEAGLEVLVLPSPSSPLKILLEFGELDPPKLPNPVKEPKRSLKRLLELPPVKAPKRPLRSVLFGPKAISTESIKIWIRGTLPVITKLFNTCS